MDIALPFAQNARVYVCVCVCVCVPIYQTTCREQHLHTRVPCIHSLNRVSLCDLMLSQNESTQSTPVQLLQHVHTQNVYSIFKLDYSMHARLLIMPSMHTRNFNFTYIY